jgi:diguanylate cyclase (GGDEF)-like protein/PAS domain S-box-containing protein
MTGKRTRLLKTTFIDFQSLPLARITLIVVLFLLVFGFIIAVITAWRDFLPLVITLSVALVFLAGGFIILSRWFLASVNQKIDKISTTSRRYHNIVKYYESVLQDSTDIIFTIDRDGLILKFNKGSQLHFGYTQAEIVGKPFRNLFVNEADNQKILDAVLQLGKSVNEEIPMKTKEGEIIHLNLSISEMKDETARIIGMVVTAKDITEKKKLELELLKKNELLEKLAITDPMTELYNPRHFYDQIKRELSRLKRNPGRVLSLSLLDVDHFKEYNDTEGHQRGDEVLKSLATIMKGSIRRDIDSCYRYGGDEFIILLPDTDKLHAQVVAERIQKQFNSLKLGRTSLSIGIAQANETEDEMSLVKRADEMMYQSKKGGRGRISM